MVEMMLLLVIVSLMLASGVAVISKKHVKVPRLAVHGAYMCYRDSIGRLHEEKYLGAGLTNKILDNIEEVTPGFTQCVFTPPARASYFHIQATGGGGGGGAAGYQGGNIVTYESKTEVITPFGIKQELLDLKGIAETELKNLGGKLWAYADGTGEFGDGGKGGDLYYIHQECSSECLYYREWQYNGTRERECEPSQTQVTVTHIERQYSYPDTESCGSTYSPALCDECDDWYYEDCEGTDCDKCSGGYKTEDCGSSCTASECTKWSEPDEDGVKTCLEGERETNYCIKGTKKTDKCISGHNNITSYGTCTDTYGIPDDATCEGIYEDLKVDVKNTYADNVGKLPSYRVLYTDGRSEPKLKRGEDLKERQVLRDKGEAHTICNYGNTSLYQNSENVDGIFGSFSDADGVGVECNTAALREAFGEQMYYLELAADTSTHTTVTLGACEAYGLEDCSERYSFPYYLLTEEKGGLAVFGESYRNVYDAPEGEGGSNTDTNPVWTDPYGNRHDDTYQSIQTDCDIEEYDTHDDTSGCDYYRNNSSKYTFTGKTWTTTSREWATTSYSCPRKDPTSSEAKCLYSYDDVAAVDPEQEKYCAYIPQVATGGAKGLGKFCALNDVEAGLGIQYMGNSSIIAGINGSDLMLIGGDYAPLYTKGAWEASLNNTGAAETGTESQGSARVELGGNWCAIHENAVPGRGTGAKKIEVGKEDVEPGEDAPSGGPGEEEGSIQGAGYTEDKSRKCGENHVGYCLKASGKDINVRENGKYTYQYTWQTNYLQYGEGGKAGEYRVKIIRSFDNKNIEITLGRGGAGGTGPNDCDGKDGTDTIVGDLLTAKGGAGGKGCIPTSTEQMPYWYEDGDFIAQQPGGSGELASVTNYKTNIINLVLPVDNTILGDWMASSGAGGNGGGSTNNCWASEWERYFEGEQLSVATGGKLDSTDPNIQACRNEGYDSEPGQDGFDGVVLIKW